VDVVVYQIFASAKSLIPCFHLDRLRLTQCDASSVCGVQTTVWGRQFRRRVYRARHRYSVWHRVRYT
jgi:hypothetical protein